MEAIQADTEWAVWEPGAPALDQAHGTKGQPGRIDPERRIRILAEHPDGDWIYEETRDGTNPVNLALNKISEEDLRRDYRPLPFEFTESHVRDWLRKIEANNDDEVRREEEEKLYRGVLETLLVFPLEKKERDALIQAMLDRPGRHDD